MSDERQLVDRLFRRLGSMYGMRWADLWVGFPMDEVKDDWAKSLTGIEPDAMRFALEAIEKKGNPHPPSLPEFKSLCVQFRRVGSRPTLTIVDKRHEGPVGGFQTLKEIIRKSNGPMGSK